MRVVVTRPLPAARRTASKLEELSHDALILPLAQAVHHITSVGTALAATSGPIAVTSTEAISVLLALGADLAPHLARPLFTVGDATAANATEAGFTDVKSASGTGEDLARLISRIFKDQPELKAETLLYLAGTPRASSFEDLLRQLGIPLHVAESYDMQLLTPDQRDIDAMLQSPPDAVLFYSRQAVVTFFSLAGISENLPHFSKTRWLCLSPRVAEAVPKHCLSNVKVANMPEESSLFMLL